MKSNKNDDSWTQLNNITKHVTGNKVSPSKLWKRLITTIVALVMVVGAAVSTFFIGLAMQSVFNMGNFKTELPDNEHIIVDMGEVPIHVSDTSLRLPYFEERIKEQVFAIMIKDFWWTNLLPTDITKYDFIYYSNSGVEGLDNSFVQKDGLTHFQLKIKLRYSPFEFELPIIAIIKNTAKFYEKFMMFNQYEGRFSKHISGETPNPTPGFPNLLEERYHGYLSYGFHYSTIVDNTVVYQTIKEGIDRFTSDYSEEFASNTHLYPIISTIPLNDVDINDPTTFDSYLKLVSVPSKNYVGNAPKGDSKEYVNLDSYSAAASIPPFYITYVSNPNVVYDLINLKPTTDEQIVTYFKSNPIDYIPFSMVQEAEDNSDTVVSYSPEHKLTSILSGIPGHFKYWELAWYFYTSHSINNAIETINADSYANIGVLTQFLENKYWLELYNYALSHENFFNLLNFPVPGAGHDANWAIATNSLSAFKSYFMTALGVNTLDLTTFSFLDVNHEEIMLNPSDIIKTNEIKNIRFHVGQDLKTSWYFSKPHSFNFFFKVKWI